MRDPGPSDHVQGGVLGSAPPQPVPGCPSKEAPFCFADLVNVFEVFLPQLLLYPNTAHGLNDEAAAMLMHEPTAFNKKVQGEATPPTPLPLIPD